MSLLLLFFLHIGQNGHEYGTREVREKLEGKARKSSHLNWVREIIFQQFFSSAYNRTTKIRK